MRSAVRLPCSEAQLRVGHLTVMHGKTQDPRYAHREADQAGEGPSIEVHRMIRGRASSTACHRRRDPHHRVANDSEFCPAPPRLEAPQHQQADRTCFSDSPDRCCAAHGAQSPWRLPCGRRPPTRPTAGSRRCTTQHPNVVVGMGLACRGAAPC